MRGVVNMKNKELREKINDILPDISIFGGLDKQLIDDFVKELSEKQYKKGEIIFEEGGSPSDSYLVIDGKVKLTVSGRRVDKFGVGIIFGIDSPIGIQKQITTAIADTDLTLAIVPKMTLYNLSEKNPKLFGKIVLNMARDLARSIKSMKEIIDDFIILEKDNNL